MTTFNFHFNTRASVFPQECDSQSLSTIYYFFILVFFSNLRLPFKPRIKECVEVGTGCKESFLLRCHSSHHFITPWSSFFVSILDWIALVKPPALPSPTEAQFLSSKDPAGSSNHCNNYHVGWQTTVHLRITRQSLSSFKAHLLKTGTPSKGRHLLMSAFTEHTDCRG